MSDTYYPKSDKERIATLEVQYAELAKKFEQIDGKLDQLIDLKNKGAGAFLLISALFGSSIIGAAYYLLSIFKHH